MIGVISKMVLTVVILIHKEVMKEKEVQVKDITFAENNYPGS